MSLIEVVRSGQRDGKFQLYCISEVENGRYLVFTLAVEDLSEPYTEPDRESAIEWANKFFENSDSGPG